MRAAFIKTVSSVPLVELLLLTPVSQNLDNSIVSKTSTVCSDPAVPFANKFSRNRTKLEKLAIVCSILSVSPAEIVQQILLKETKLVATIKATFSVK